MKRSDINREIHRAEDFFASHHFFLPKFAFWDMAEWRRQTKLSPEIFTCNLGWDMTDFGSGDFASMGLFLFTIRNGVIGSQDYPKGYAEKIMISRSEQVTLMHCHVTKREDIINRGGGNLVFELFNGTISPNVTLDNTDVRLARDGQDIVVPAGQKLFLEPGESVSLTPGIFHKFYAEKGSDVLIGEVSSVNDDHNDNVFYGKQMRFPKVEEDEPMYRPLVADYQTLLAGN